MWSGVRSVLVAMRTSHNNARGQCRDREGLIKAENIIVILLRTEIIGLKDWLYWVGVLVGSLRCECG